MDITKYDDDVRALIDTCMEQQKGRNRHAISSLEKLKRKAERLHDDALIGFACFYLANTHYRQNLNYHDFRSYLVKGITHLQRAHENALLVRAYNYVGIDASNNGCYDVSYHYFMMAQRVAESLDDAYLRSLIASNIGQLYARLGNYHLARESVRRSIDLAMNLREDLYSLHNLISGCYLDGIFSIRLHDLRGARKAMKTVNDLTGNLSGNDTLGTEIVVSILRMEIALLENDREFYRGHMKSFVSLLKTSPSVFDFIEDITGFCQYLIEQNELPAARDILDCIDDNALRSGSLQMIWYVTEVEITYHEVLGDAEKLGFYLRRLHDLERRRQSEQNRIYFMSIGLIDSLNDYLKTHALQSGRDVPVADDIPRTKEFTDEMTSLPNRRALSRMLRLACMRAHAASRMLGVAVLRLDQFDKYAKKHDEKACGILLQRVGLELRVVSYQYECFCARHDGGLFVMVFENKTEEEIREVLAALDRKIEELDRTAADNTGIAFARGVCFDTPHDGDAPTDFLIEAYTALSEAKKGKRLPFRTLPV